MDPYVYPGTNVFRNLRNIRDADLLNQFEAEASSRRLRQLEHRPLKGSFDTRHLQAIHRHIFQDIYDWAGKFRTVNISKSSDTFAFHEHIVSCLDQAFANLKQDVRPFAARAAWYLGEINAAHPFREGNGRAQREFIRQLAVSNGWQIDWTKISRDQMIEASRQSLRISNAGLEDLLRTALTR
jgi:cell filamentation protein